MLEDLAVGAQTEDQEGENSDDDDEGNESPKSQELSRQIDSYMVVLDEEHPKAEASASDQTTRLIVASDP